LIVETLGDEVGVEVYEAVLDFRALTVVAEHVAEKLNTPEGRQHSVWRQRDRSQNGAGYHRFECGLPILGSFRRSQPLADFHSPERSARHAESLGNDGGQRRP
jgi:hypothetical protein